jgi:ankyrin repeat protein
MGSVPRRATQGCEKTAPACRARDAVPAGAGRKTPARDEAPALRYSRPVGWWSFSRSKGDALVSAAAKGDLAAVAELIEAGTEVDWANDKGLTALIMASYAGRTGIARLLLESKADPSKPNADGETPLLVCANTTAAAEIVPLLLAAGAAVGGRTRDGRTALSAHAQGGRLEAVRALLDAGAGVNDADERGVAPLLLAVENGHADVVSLLVDRGADPTRRTIENGLTPLGCAIAKGNIAVGERLLDIVDPNDAVVFDLPGLFFAAKSKRAAFVPRLVERGAAVDFCHPKVGSTLAAAVISDDLATLDALLLAGVPVDLRSETGAQPLHIAAYAGRFAMVERLIAAGADIHSFTNTRGTPLRAAAAQGHAEIVRLLLSLGADPEPVDAFGRRPIDDARDAGHQKIVRLLGTTNRPQAPSREPAPRAPLAALLPERSDASLSSAIHAMREGSGVLRAGASSVEAPSAVAAIRDFEPMYQLSFRVDTPDPRRPARPVEVVLWRYENFETASANATPALAPPRSEISTAAGRIAQVPYLLRIWSDHAAKTAAAFRPDDALDFAAVMVHPPARPTYIEPWNWRFRVQVAAALILSHLGSEKSTNARRQRILEDIIDGPADWTNTAAIIALYDVARRDPRARNEVIATLIGVTQRPMTPPVFQHAIQPAAFALLDLPELDRELRSALTELVREPDAGPSDIEASTS